MMRCFHSACGKEYDSADDSDTACVYHPGGPVFHEGLKGWSCCKKRTTDFGEFLSMPGCSTGRHNPNKPEEVQKEKPTAPPPLPRPPSPVAQRQTSVVCGSPRRINLEHTPAAKANLAKLHARLTAEKEAQAATGNNTIAEGTLCLNKGCGAAYSGDGVHHAPCNHHPGEPVFHEGMKYWSCCNRRTTDFQAFLDQAGCTQGTHKWEKDAHDDVQTVNCRYDYFQGAESIALSIYAKNIDPDHSDLEIGGRLLNCHLQFEGNKTFHLNLPLYAEVVPEKCSARIVGTKLEVTLFKADAMTWPQLEG